ncbi:hypothetical protein EDD86DRAFT_212143 [Gorgonomyces haynaldii]|nr:hypothetical protein EDD86DRAFT_212143 [Gorgonomyces haynaldii]
MSSHRSGLKQSNKSFKSKHATKGQAKRENKGKVNRQPVKGRHTTVSKQDRRNQSKQDQKTKRMDQVRMARLYNGMHATPKIVAVVPLCPDVSAHKCVEEMFKSVDTEVTPDYVLPLERFKQRLQFVPAQRHLLEILDACRIADFIIFVLSANEEVDAFGEHCMTLIKAQGVVQSIHVVQHLETNAPKMQHAVRGSLIYYMTHHFPEQDKLYALCQPTECVNALRQLTSQTPHGIHWRDRHAYVVADNVQHIPGEDTLLVSGFVRGNNLSANRLVHIPDFGDYQIERINLCPTKSHEMVEDTLLEQPDENQDDLVSENEPNPLDAEQTWPTEDEIMEAEERVRDQEHMQVEEPFEGPVHKKRVPKGTSSYQAAWIVDDVSDEEVSSDEEMTEIQHNDEEEEPEYEEVEMDNRSELFNELDEDENEEQLQEYLRQKEHRDHREFPDEVDTPQEIPARERFARYRGLKSFRHSPWDPYENLPEEYARIFQFQNFKRSKKRVMDGLEEGVSVGTHVTIALKNVPSAVAEAYQNKLLCLFSLLPYEHKISVVNFVIKPSQSYQEPVKSKDQVILMSGFRRFVAQPIYSSYTRGGPNNVHKFERYLPNHQPSVATIYGRIQFGPAPVMMFKFEQETSWTPERVTSLIGTGNVLDLDPLRVITKRIILTGDPFKIHKRGAVVRFMFFNPEDVKYFKPVQLVTKMGRVGHIRESLGTHGYMKCIFDSAIKQHDTVMMMLYKRVFPKMSTRLWSQQ